MSDRHGEVVTVCCGASISKDELEENIAEGSCSVCGEAASRDQYPAQKVFLLFEWTDERESKIHHGIFSTVELAKARADAEAEECEEDPLNWSTDGPNNWIGMKSHGYTKDQPYEIEEFEVDAE